MKSKIAPSKWSSFFANERVFMTKQETRCLKVLLKRSIWLVCPVAFPTATCRSWGNTSWYDDRKSVENIAWFREMSGKAFHHPQAPSLSRFPTWSPTIGSEDRSLASQSHCWSAFQATHPHHSSHSTVNRSGRFFFRQHDVSWKYGNLHHGHHSVSIVRKRVVLHK